MASKNEQPTNADLLAELKEIRAELARLARLLSDVQAAVQNTESKG